MSRHHHLPPQLLLPCLSGSLSSRNAGFLSSSGTFQPCCGLRASELCFPFPQSPFPRETHSLTPFTSLLLYHLPSDIFIGSFTKHCKPSCSTHWHPFVLSCSVFPIECGISWHHFHFTLLHGDMDIEVQVRPSPVSCEGCTPLVAAAKDAVKSGPGRCEAASVMHTIQMPTGIITP